MEAITSPDSAPVNKGREKPNHESGFDPLLASTELPHRVHVFPLGFPVTVSTNDAEVVLAAQLSWGKSFQRFSVPTTDFRVVVSGACTKLPHLPPVYRAQQHLMVAVSDAHHFGVCELAGGFGFACTSKALLSDGDSFRYHFLEGLIYSLLDTTFLATIHSACVSWRGRGVLLIGESGAGKSSFAYGCARRGWEYTADDATSLLLDQPGRTVLGNPNGFRFRPSIATLFPELKGHVRDRNGKPTIEIRTEALPNVVRRASTSIDLILFLRRQTRDCAVSFVPISQLERFERLSPSPWPVGLATNQARRRAIWCLSEADGYELDYCEVDDAIDAIERVLLKRSEST
jgi:hypothetical protein